MKSFIARFGKPILTALVVVSVCALLVATLWPFDPTPPNQVSWLGGEDGLRFGDYGTVFSAGEFPQIAGGEHESFSIEYWMRPGRTKDTNVMIAFYTKDNPGQFVMRQDESDLALMHTGPNGRHAKAVIVGEVIARGRDTLATVTAGPDGTTVYVDGRARKFAPDLGLSLKDINGEMLVGNSPVGNNSWSGILRGLAIYRKKLTPEEVSSHYAAWKANNTDQLDKQSMLAFYLFRERSGQTVKNEIPGGIGLSIPLHYTIWRQYFMRAPWQEFQASPAYIKDLFENVVGFIPLGLVLYPYFLVVRRSNRPWLMSYLTGAILSLTIEILQSFLPARYSGWTDVITNSTGAALGASVYLWSGAQRFLRSLFGEKEAKKAA